MGAESPYTQGTFFHDDLSSAAKSSGCIYDVVYQNNMRTRHIADYLHGGNLIGANPVLITNGKLFSEVFGINPGPGYSTNIRRSKHKFIQTKSFDIRHKESGSIQVINREIEKTLNLSCMQIQCHKTLDTGCGKKVGNQL